MSPVRYELGFYIPGDGILHSHRREDHKCKTKTMFETRGPYRETQNLHVRFDVFTAVTMKNLHIPAFVSTFWTTLATPNSSTYVCRLFDLLLVRNVNLCSEFRLDKWPCLCLEDLNVFWNVVSPSTRWRFLRLRGTSLIWRQGVERGWEGWKSWEQNSGHYPSPLFYLKYNSSETE
jgi:hypothetical protein